MGYYPSELKARRRVLGAQARRRRHGRAGLGAGCWARRHGAGDMGARARAAPSLGRQALGRAGSGRHGRVEHRRARARSGTAWLAGRAGSWAGARTIGRSRRADTAWTRRGARQVQAGARGGPAGRPVRAWCAQLGQVGCFAAPDSVFGLVRLGIFPESPNEHCSL